MKTTPLVVLLGVILSASAQSEASSWSVTMDAGSARLGGSDLSLYDTSTGLRAAWWLTPDTALEAGHSITDNGAINESGALFDVGPARTSSLGVRHLWRIGGDNFVVLRAGAGHVRQSRTTALLTPFLNEFGNGYTLSTTAHGTSSTAPYAGIGLGRQWNPRWSSSMEFSRSRTSLANRCFLDGICTPRSSNLDLFNASLSFHFD